MKAQTVAASKFRVWKYFSDLLMVESAKNLKQIDLLKNSVYY